jgi:hypothetical protein
LLVEELLAAGSLVLASASSSLVLPASAGSLLVDKLLTAGHLAGTSVLLVDEREFLAELQNSLCILCGDLQQTDNLLFRSPRQHSEVR